MKAHELKNEITELITRLKGLNKDQYALSEEVETLKNTKNELKQKLVIASIILGSHQIFDFKYSSRVHQAKVSNRHLARKASSGIL